MLFLSTGPPKIMVVRLPSLYDNMCNYTELNYRFGGRSVATGKSVHTLSTISVPQTLLRRMNKKVGHSHWGAFVASL